MPDRIGLWRALCEPGKVGRLAQLAEQLTLNQRVAGSNPSSPITQLLANKALADGAGRAPMTDHNFQAIADQIDEFEGPLQKQDNLHDFLW